MQKSRKIGNNCSLFLAADVEDTYMHIASRIHVRLMSFLMVPITSSNSIDKSVCFRGI